MIFNEKVKSDLECLKRVLQKLIEHKCDEVSIAIVTGMIEGLLTFVENNDEK